MQGQITITFQAVRAYSAKLLLCSGEEGLTGTNFFYDLGRWALQEQIAFMLHGGGAYRDKLALYFREAGLTGLNYFYPSGRQGLQKLTNWT